MKFVLFYPVEFFTQRRLILSKNLHTRIALFQNYYVRIGKRSCQQQSALSTNKHENVIILDV